MKSILNSFLVFVAVSTAYSQIDNSKQVANINGESILAGDYYRRMEYLPGVGKRVGDKIIEYPPGFLALEQMITERLVFQLAKNKSCLPSDAEVQAELRYILEQNPKFETTWIEGGRTKEELLYQIRYELTQFKLATYTINVTDIEIENFYKQNPTSFTIPKRVKIRAIAATTKENCDKVDAQLKAGKKFDEVAKALSEDTVTQPTGGDFGTQPITSFPDNVRTTLDPLKAGQTSAWLLMGKTYVKFMVEEVIAPVKEPLDPALKRNIRKRMMLDRGRVKNDVTKELLELRKNSKIEIANKDFMELYSRFVQTILGDSGKVSGGGG